MLGIFGAAQRGNFKRVKELVENGVDANGVDWSNKNMTALHYAVISRSLDIVECLIGHGASINCGNSKDRTALHYAVKSKSFHIVKYLIENGADVNCKDRLSETPLHIAATSGSLKMVRFLVENNADVNCKAPEGKTALHFAAESKAYEIVKYLVERGAKVISEYNENFKTVLYVACESGDSQIVDYLLQHGAVNDIDRHDNLDCSPLKVACFRGHTAVVQTLLKFNVNIKNNKQLICGNEEILTILKFELREVPKSVKHGEKFHILKNIDVGKLKKIGPPLQYFASEKQLSLGCGSFGTSVYVGILEDGSEVAVKRILREAADENEIAVLRRIDTTKLPYILSYRYFLEDENFKYIIFDLCEETLSAYVKSQNVPHLREQGPRMIKEILLGVKCLHDQRILHRDLKPSNILVDFEGHLKVADFGLSRVLKEGETTVKTYAKGTRGWMPAEVIEAGNEEEKGRYKKKSDIQSVGMIAFFILTGGKHPFGATMQERMTNISKGNPVDLCKLEDANARHFVAWLISHDIDNRPYASEALEDYMFHNIKSVEANLQIIL